VVEVWATEVSEPKSTAIVKVSKCLFMVQRYKKV
jgi:hypothetical protein